MAVLSDSLCPSMTAAGAPVKGKLLTQRKSKMVGNSNDDNDNNSNNNNDTNLSLFPLNHFLIEATFLCVSHGSCLFCEKAGK